MNCALITGGSRGIGRAIALQLAKDHQLHILINYSADTAAAQETLDKIMNQVLSRPLNYFPGILCTRVISPATR